MTDPMGSSGKAEGAMRTIGEVSAELGVKPHILRYWEAQFDSIKPLKRAGGRRYYRPEDVDLVAGIKHLLHVRRYTIKGAQRIIKDNGIRFVQAVGRGEVVAAPPPLQDLDGGVEGQLPDDTTVIALPGEDQAALEDALHELRTCRALLDALRQPPD